METVNTASVVLMVVFCAGIAGLALSAARRPRFAQLAFLVVAAFILTNKVYSPQYVLWLIPLAVLARPRWRDFLVWQACEVMYFLGIWFYLAYTSGGTSARGCRRRAIRSRSPCTCWARCTCARWSSGTSCCRRRTRCARTGRTTRQGGVLDGAPDAFVLAPDARPSGHAARTDGHRAEWGATPTRNGWPGGCRKGRLRST
ncbi:membrane protein [Streptomyces badius]